MSTPIASLKQIVIEVLKNKPGQALKPAEIAAIIIEKYPEYCEQKIQGTTQADFNLQKQISNEISARRKQWHDPQLKSSEETPRTYWWEEADSSDEVAAVTSEKALDIAKAESLAEMDLYPKLAQYLDAMEPHKLYVKRIDEKCSSNTKGKNGNKYLHPDMVALEDLMPQPLWSGEMKEWATKAGARQSKIWSFEVKTEIMSVAEARENCRQALTNSAWANYGYLVATKISKNAFNELKVLNDLHGIGLIELDVENPADETVIKLPAREQARIDWGICNRIASQNDDFKKFVELVADFHQTRKARDIDWDNPKLSNLEQ